MWTWKQLLSAFYFNFCSLSTNSQFQARLFIVSVERIRETSDQERSLCCNLVSGSSQDVIYPSEFYVRVCVRACVRVCACVRVPVCVRTRARACLCVCVCERACAFVLYVNILHKIGKICPFKDCVNAYGL